MSFFFFDLVALFCCILLFFFFLFFFLFAFSFSLFLRFSFSREWVKGGKLPPSCMIDFFTIILNPNRLNFSAFCGNLIFSLWEFKRAIRREQETETNTTAAKAK